jgi:acetate kinase
MENTCLSPRVLATGESTLRLQLFNMTELSEELSSHRRTSVSFKQATNSIDFQAFENTSTNIAAAQMRNALTNLAETCKDPEQKKASRRNPQVACRTA